MLCYVRSIIIFRTGKAGINEVEIVGVDGGAGVWCGYGNQTFIYKKI